MNDFINNILETGKVYDATGMSYKLHSHTSKEQCKFIQDIIADLKPTNTLEIGLAYGISTLAILDALAQNSKSFCHYVIDPLQEDWRNVGLLNIEKLGFSKQVKFYPKLSDQVLPQMYFDNSRIQFAYVDSTKVFDALLVDLYFINKILDVNGILILDDCDYPGIRLLVRFLTQHPCYELFKVLDKDKSSVKRTLAKKINYAILNSLPFTNKIMPNYNFAPDEQLGVDYHCIAFRKISEDNRNWDWYKPF